MKNYKSCLSIVLIAVVYITSMCFYKPYRAMYNQSGGDAFGYYVYLPAFFIHHDLATLHTNMTAKYSHCRPGTKADSSYQNKYFIGTAVLQAPFFLLAHVFAGYFHQPRDGFSMIYMYAVELSCLIYGLLALVFLMFILKRYFSDSIVAMVVIIIALATNLYYLIVGQATFSHTYLFFLYSVLLFATLKFYDSYRRRYILLIGLVCGLIILTRINEVYAVLIPMFWGIRTWASLKERPGLLMRFILPILAAGFVMFLCLVPQIMYWKISSGHFLYYSYTDEKFNFRHPHIWDGLTSGSNGWLLYCPIMILALIGIWPAIRHRHPSFVPIIVFLPVHIYVIYSWWCWFYMGSYGSRPMTEAYALLCFPLAYSVQWFWRSWAGKIALGAIVVFFSWVVMFQTYQFSLNIFNSELSNWRYNLITFGKTQLTYEESVVLDTKEFQPCHPVYVRMLGENAFEDAGIAGSDTSVATSGHRSVCVHQGQICMGYTAILSQAGAKPRQWIKASINCLAKVPTDHNWHLASLVMAFTRKGKMTKWCTVSLQNKINNPKHEIWHFPINEWGRVYFYSQLPSDMMATDTISVYVENKHNGPDIYVDDLKVELYEEK